MEGGSLEVLSGLYVRMDICTSFLFLLFYKGAFFAVLCEYIVVSFEQQFSLKNVANLYKFNYHLCYEYVEF